MTYYGLWLGLTQRHRDSEIFSLAPRAPPTTHGDRPLGYSRSGGESVSSRDVRDVREVVGANRFVFNAEEAE